MEINVTARWIPLLSAVIATAPVRAGAQAAGEGARAPVDVTATDYARFRTDPGQPDLDARRRRDAADVVEQFLAGLEQAPG